jgi:cyanophycinase-like exopeptidase
VPGLLTLIGSGETAAGMVRVHRSLLARLDSPARPVFLDTPAGFELGLAAIDERFVDYFKTRLGLPLTIASYRGRDDPPASVGRAVAAIRQSNYVLAGPGSPTYAVRHWKDSPVLEALLERWREGAQLVFASSAAVAIGRHTLPVYEIYKVGQPLHWIDGLDLLGSEGFDLAVVPHWDNTQGGTHDTRACFVGLERFERLRRMLPGSTVVLGIDEHTACIIDMQGGRLEVRGRGGVTILRGDQTRHIPSGEHAPLVDLRPLEAPAAGAPRPLSERDMPLTRADAQAIQSAERIAQGDVASGLRLAAASAPPALASVLVMAADQLDMAVHAPAPELWIDVLLRARQALRAAGQWSAADEIRRALAEQGITLRDTPEGTVRDAGA